MCRVLLVDDEDLELQGLSFMIEGFGLPLQICATARNGQEGLEKARALRPEIILTDLRMPVLSGIEMVSRVSCEGYAPHAVIISGYEDFEAARAGMELGVSCYLLKPVKREELFQALCRLCPAEVRKEHEEGLPDLPAASFLYPPEEEHILRHALTVTQEKAREILAQPPFCTDLERKRMAVFAVQFPVAVDADMYDLRPFLQRFAKETEALVPVVMDSRTSALVMTMPGFMDDAGAVDHLSKAADRLLEEFHRQRIRDAFIGISDIAETPDKLPALCRQSLSALEKKADSPLSHVLFFEERDGARKISQPNTIVAYVQRFIDENYAKPLSIETIVEGLYLSPSYIRRLFKSHMGISVMEYVERVRMNHAARLLSRLQYKVQEIGMRVGYESPSYFNLVFKKYFGVTPGEYRRLMTKSE